MRLKPIVSEIKRKKRKSKVLKRFAGGYYFVPFAMYQQSDSNDDGGGDGGGDGGAMEESSNQKPYSYLIETDDTTVDDQKFSNTKLFMEFVLEKLNINTPVKVVLTANRDLYNLKTLAHFNNENSECVVYSNNRNLADVLRSIAHELVHKKQFEKDEIEEPIQDIGGPVEDEANAVAGQLVKEFGYKNPKIFE